MRQIGARNAALSGAIWSSNFTGMLAPVMLFVADDPNEQVGPLWKAIGWVLLGDAEHGGGVIYSDRLEAGKNSVPVYERAPAPVPAAPTLEDRVAALEEFNEGLEPTLKKHAELLSRHTSVIGHRTPAEPLMTFYDHAFIAASMASHAKGRGLDIQFAHEVAATLTAHRHPKAGA